MAAGDVVLDSDEMLVDVTVSGYSLHSAIYIPFGTPKDPASWFDAPQYESIKLKLTGEASLGVTKVLTQQMRH